MTSYNCKFHFYLKHKIGRLFHSFQNENTITRFFGIENNENKYVYQKTLYNFQIQIQFQKC